MNARSLAPPSSSSLAPSSHSSLAPRQSSSLAPIQARSLAPDRHPLRAARRERRRRPSVALDAAARPRSGGGTPRSPSTRRSARAPRPRITTCHGPYTTWMRPPSDAHRDLAVVVVPRRWPRGRRRGSVNGPDSHSVRSTGPTHSVRAQSLVHWCVAAAPARPSVRPNRRCPRGTGKPAPSSSPATRSPSGAAAGAAAAAAGPAAAAAPWRAAAAAGRARRVRWPTPPPRTLSHSTRAAADRLAAREVDAARARDLDEVTLGRLQPDLDARRWRSACRWSKNHCRSWRSSRWSK